jgi:hypothetical protein
MFLPCLCLALASATLTYAEESHGSAPVTSTQIFDSYGDIPFEDEKAHLDNFAIQLQSEPGYIGYIIVYAGRRACVGEAQRRAIRAKRYLIERRGVDENLIIWRDGGYREELTVELFIVARGAPAPTPSPHLSPRDVRIIRCDRRNHQRRVRNRS